MGQNIVINGEVEKGYYNGNFSIIGETINLCEHPQEFKGCIAITDKPRFELIRIPYLKAVIIDKCSALNHVMVTLRERGIPVIRNTDLKASEIIKSGFKIQVRVLSGKVILLRGYEND